MKSLLVLAAGSLLATGSPFSPISLALSHQQTSPLHSQLHAGITDITTSPAAGFFNAHPWEIKISKDGNSYIYSGKNIDTKTSISLASGRLTKSQGKHFYKWRNSGTLYQVTWQPTDPMYARLQVFDGRGKTLLNKLMWTPPEN
jgi:hypothetical protein